MPAIGASRPLSLPQKSSREQACAKRLLLLLPAIVALETNEQALRVGRGQKKRWRFTPDPLPSRNPSRPWAAPAKNHAVRAATQPTWMPGSR